MFGNYKIRNVIEAHYHELLSAPPSDLREARVAAGNGGSCAVVSTDIRKITDVPYTTLPQDTAVWDPDTNQLFVSEGWSGSNGGWGPSFRYVYFNVLTPVDTRRIKSKIPAGCVEHVLTQCEELGVPDVPTWREVVADSPHCSGCDAVLTPDRRDSAQWVDGLCPHCAAKTVAEWTHSAGVECHWVDRGLLYADADHAWMGELRWRDRAVDAERIFYTDAHGGRGHRHRLVVVRAKSRKAKVPASADAVYVPVSFQTWRGKYYELLPIDSNGRALDINSQSYYYERGYSPQKAIEYMSLYKRAPANI